jgi:hypothetical protein
MNYFNKSAFKSKKYPIVYISTHGLTSTICLEGVKEDKRKKKQDEENDESKSEIKLSELAKISNGFFKDRIVHFSSCLTLRNIDATLEFKQETGALYVSGYQKSVDAMRSVILDMAYLNALQCYHPNTLVKETSRFQKRYCSLIEDLKFLII